MSIWKLISESNMKSDTDALRCFLLSFFFFFFLTEKIMELEEQVNLGSSKDSLVHKVYLLRYFVFLNMRESENKSYWKGDNLGNKTLPTILAIVMRWKVNIEAVSLSAHSSCIICQDWYLHCCSYIGIIDWHV